jgi:hypothetical protein
MAGRGRVLAGWCVAGGERPPLTPASRSARSQPFGHLLVVLPSQGSGEVSTARQPIIRTRRQSVSRSRWS